MSLIIKVAATAAAGAFVLSTLTGVVAGVRFSAVVLRALASAVIFGGSSAALFIAAQRLLPGITDPAAGDDGVAAARGTDDHDPRGNREKEGATAPPPPGSRVEIILEDDDDADVSELDDSDTEEMDSEPTGDDLVEEVQEQVVDDEEAAFAATAAEGSDALDARLAGVTDEEMPDIGSFAGSFVAPGGEGEEEAVEYEQSAPSGKSGDAQANGSDPKVIARALQTMLKRD